MKFGIFLIIMSMFQAVYSSDMIYNGYNTEIIDSSNKELLVSITIPNSEIEEEKKKYSNKGMLISQLGDNKLLLKITKENITRISQDNQLDYNLKLHEWRNSLLKTYKIKPIEKVYRKVKVALIDTGFNRPDLKIQNINYSKKNHTNHGSHVGGIILAINPYIEMISYNVYDKTDAKKTVSNTIKAVNDAILKKVDIINLSWDGTELSYNKEEEKAYLKAQKAGILIVVAGGNSSMSLSKNDCKEFPACYKTVVKEMLLVGNIQNDNTISKTSNTGPMIDLYYYGANIKSLAKNDGFIELSGTSQSAPFITGLASQIMMENQEKLSLDQIKQELIKTNSDILHKKVNPLNNLSDLGYVSEIRLK